MKLNGVGLEIRRLTSRFPSASLNKVINDIADWTSVPPLEGPFKKLGFRQWKRATWLWKSDAPNILPCQSKQICTPNVISHNNVTRAAKGKYEMGQGIFRTCVKYHKMGKHLLRDNRATSNFIRFETISCSREQYRFSSTRLSNNLSETRNFCRYWFSRIPSRGKEFQSQNEGKNPFT